MSATRDCSNNHEYSVCGENLHSIKDINFGTENTFLILVLCVLMTWSVQAHNEARDTPSVCSMSYLLLFPCMMMTYICIKRREVSFPERESFPETQYDLFFSNVHATGGRVVSSNVLHAECELSRNASFSRAGNLQQRQLIYYMR